MAVPCIFQTKYRLGENNARLALFGDSSVLGEWTPRKACFADYLGEDDLYEVTVYLSVNTVCHFKWCIIDKNYNIIYCDNQKQRAFRVENTMMYIKAPWSTELTVIPVRHRIGRNSPDKVVLVMFQMNLSNNMKGRQLCLVGSVRALGSWLMNDGRVAECSPTMGSVTAYLHVGSIVEFKWILRDQDEMNATWEEGPNRTYSVEDNTVTVIECVWNQPQSYWTCNHQTTREPTTKGTWLKPMQYYTPESPPVTLSSNNEIMSPQETVSYNDKKVWWIPNKQHLKYYLIAGFTAILGYGLCRAFDPS